jgi:hypothetical protein
MSDGDWFLERLLSTPPLQRDILQRRAAKVMPERGRSRVDETCPTADSGSSMPGMPPIVTLWQERTTSIISEGRETMGTTADGFVTGDDTEFMGKVARRLEELDLALGAYVEHTGGGIFCIALASGDRGFYWGTEYANWEAQVNDQDGACLDDFLTTDVPSDSADAEAVADAIQAATRRYLHERAAG